MIPSFVDIDVEGRGTGLSVHPVQLELSSGLITSSSSNICFTPVTSSKVWTRRLLIIKFKVTVDDGHPTQAPINLSLTFPVSSSKPVESRETCSGYTLDFHVYSLVLNKLT